jgi:hypothetical protein
MKEAMICQDRLGTNPNGKLNKTVSHRRSLKGTATVLSFDEQDPR